MTLPPAGYTFPDPRYGTSIRRLTDARSSLDYTRGSALLTQCRPEYSTCCPWNLDNTLLLIQTDNYFRLHSGDGMYLGHLPFRISAGGEPRWSRRSANVLYFLEANRLVAYTIASDTCSDVRTFSEYTKISGKGEGDFSQDHDRLVLCGDDHYVFIYDIRRDAKSGVLQIGSRALDSIYIAPDGKSFTCTWVSGSIDLFDHHGMPLRVLAASGSHMDICRDPRTGVSGLVRTNSNDNPALANCENGIEWVPLDDPSQRRCLLPLDWGLAVHVSCSDIGTALVETVEVSLSERQYPYKNELVLVNLDGTVRSLCQHQSEFRGYESFPKATISRDGTKVLFGSNMGQGEENYMDAYMIRIDTPVSGASSDDSTRYGMFLCAKIKTLAAESDKVQLLADEWNYYAREVIGRPLPDPEQFGFVGESRKIPIRFDIWLKSLVAAGLAKEYGLE